MDKYTRQSLQEMRDMLKNMNPEKYKKKIQLLEEKLEIQTDFDDEKRTAEGGNVTKPGGQVA